MKGQIKPNHISTNNYVFTVVGLPPITATKVTGLEEELETTELPDRTRASGGNTKPTEFSITVPLHHSVEVAALERWWKDSQEPVDPNYKKSAVMVYKRIGGGMPKMRQLLGCFPTKLKWPDAEMKGEGEMAELEVNISCDQPLPVG